MQKTEREWAALLGAANAGDSVSYAKFLQAVTPVLRGIIKARGRALADHHFEDIVQETLLAIHAKRHTWSPDRPLRPWLFAITRHKVSDAYRKRGAAVHLDIDDFADQIPAEPEPDTTAGHDAEVLIAQLEPRAAEIVRAVSLRGESQDEVGERLGMSGGAVRVALHRAMKRLSTLGQETTK